jgi:signal transduction histidine kinase
VLVPGLLIAGAAVWFGIRRIVQPLQQLEGRATDLAWGDFDSIEKPVGGIEEIQQLQATLKHLANRVRSTQAGMRNYIAAITQTQEDERARLARELHDQTVQTLIALGHREQRLKRYVTDDPEAAAVLDELRGMTTQAVDDLRRIIRAMRPIYLEELGLVPALEMLAHDLNLDERAINVSFEKAGEPVRLPPDHEMALYRVAQEALSNIWQHSEANQAWLSVSYDDRGVAVSVRDNGQGFEAPRRVTDLSEKGHFGIMGMYERAALIGAHLQIASKPDQGTTVTIRAPVSPQADKPVDRES